MAVLRTDIERALDNLMSDESGMKFQGLAVILAKRRWPDLIASERKSDLGADALAKPAFAAEGEGKVLASSTTAGIDKVRIDAKRIKDNFPGISKLIFETPATVSKKREEEWASICNRGHGSRCRNQGGLVKAAEPIERASSTTLGAKLSSAPGVERQGLGECMGNRADRERLPLD